MFEISSLARIIQGLNPLCYEITDQTGVYQAIYGPGLAVV